MSALRSVGAPYGLALPTSRPGSCSPQEVSAISLTGSSMPAWPDARGTAPMVRSDLAVRLVRRPLDWVLGPEDVLRLLRSDAHPVALLGAWAGGNDIIASDPVQVRCPPQSLGDVLDAPWPMRSWPAGRMGHGGEIAAGHPGRPFGGGWIGYLGF